MPAKSKMLFSFGFSPADMEPMQIMQQTLMNDSVLRNSMWQAIMNESLMRQLRSSEQASVMAQPINENTKTDTGKEKSEKETTSTYTISYYNPILQQNEILQEKSQIKIKDYAAKMVEEAVAAQSVYPIYTFIAAPLIRTEVVPWKLQEILSEREYGTPPPPPAGAAVPPITVIQQKQSEIVEVKKREEDIKAALSESVLRIEKSERRIDEEIMLLDETVKALRGGDDIDKVIDRLPPLSRARYILALRKKLLGRQAVISLLLRDSSFLKTVKKKLEMFTTDDLMNMFKIIRNLQKKE